MKQIRTKKIERKRKNNCTNSKEKEIKKLFIFWPDLCWDWWLRLPMPRGQSDWWWRMRTSLQPNEMKLWLDRTKQFTFYTLKADAHTPLYCIFFQNYWQGILDVEKNFKKEAVLGFIVTFLDNFPKSFLFYTPRPPPLNPSTL